MALRRGKRVGIDTLLAPFIQRPENWMKGYSLPLVLYMQIVSYKLLTKNILQLTPIKPPIMKYTSLLLFSLSFLFVECKKSNEDVVLPQHTTKYFVKITADETEYTFDVAKYVYGGVPSYFFVSADSSDFAQIIEFRTTKGLTGKPESIPILGGNFAKSKIDTYETIPGSVNGMCTITKIDGKEVEGTFYFDVYKGSVKLSLKNGSFRLKLGN